MYHLLEINKNTPVPLYYQLKTSILKLIKTGQLKAGDMLPGEIDLCHNLGLSRTTVRQAIQELVNEGYVYRVKGKGSFISNPKLNQDFMNKLESFNDQILRLNKKPSTKVLFCGLADAPDFVSSQLKLSDSTQKVIKLDRLRFADGDPIVYVETYLPLSCSFILNHDLEKEALYSILRLTQGTEVIQVTRTIEAISASKKIAELLEIPHHSAVQFTTTVGFNINEEAVEYSRAYYAGEKNKFTINLKV